MTPQASQLIALAPEWALCAGILAVFGAMLARLRYSRAYAAAFAAALVALLAAALTLGEDSLHFRRAYRVDLFSQLFKLLILGGLCAILQFGRDLKDIRPGARSEYVFFLLTTALGLLVLASSVELITLVVALETASFSLYLLVPLRDEGRGLRIQLESAIKYVLFGLVSTGLMLWGISYLYGVTGTTALSVLAERLGPLTGNPLVVVGIGFALAGAFFKLAIFPFHFWITDVYEGSSNETAALIATLPKLGGMAVLVRFALLIPPGEQVLVDLLWVLSVCSMFYGNLAALVQKDLKRMLGFSSIAHAGYLIIGMVSLGERGFALAIYYTAGFVVMYLACFLVICQVSQRGENLAVEDLAGLHRRSPLLALTLAGGMFALAGIPPFVGFMGKFLLFTSAWSDGFRVLVILAALNTAVSIYYYLSVVRVSYTGDPEGRVPVRPGPAIQALCIALLGLMVLLGVAPESLVETIRLAVLGLR